jgi:N-acetylglucosamine-6-phosphate deacetylase
MEGRSMKEMALIGDVILPNRVLEAGAVIIEGEKIAGVFSADRLPPLEGMVQHDYSGCYIIPGFIDLHLHGAMGRDVMEGTADGLEEMAAHQARCGVTGFVPTTLAAPLPAILAAVEGVKAAMTDRAGAEILGLYIEGPFLSIGKKGAQNPEFIRSIRDEDIRLLAESVQPFRTIITIAPEAADNLRFIPALKEKGWVVAIGHSEATYDQAMRSFEQGITQATHLYNAMSGFHPREPGVIGAVLDSDGVTAELIADGIHVHPAALRLAIRRKGVDRICLITDSVNASGLGDGDFRVGGLDVVVKDGQARLKDSGALAGSVLTLNRAVKNILDWTGIPVHQAVQMASLTPACVLGLDREMGSIEAGKLANLSVFDRHFHAAHTIVRGRSIWGRSPRYHPSSP